MKIKVLSGVTPRNITEEVLLSQEPIHIKGFADEWPLVVESKMGYSQTIDYLTKSCSNELLNASYIPAKENGRVFYNEDMTGFNFEVQRKTFKEVSEQLLDDNFRKEFTVYIASTELARCFPRLYSECTVNQELSKGLVNLWVGGEARIAAHFDVTQNLACCLAGSRRFTLFPPEQGVNLYPGPIDFAPGGVQISTVDFHNPDKSRHPKFQEALKHSVTVELQAGDALILPSMWWHHVEGLDKVNVLLTHWWQTTPKYLGRAANALLLSIMSVRDLPAAQRAAWRELFEFYVFDADPVNFSHIPKSARSFLEQPLTESLARRIRAELQNNLRR